MASYSYAGLQVVVGADTRPLTQQIRKAATDAGQQASAEISGNVSKGFSGLKTALGGVARGAATALGTATIAATAFGVASFRTAARVGEMDATLRALAKANKLSYPEMQKSVKAIREQGIEAGVAQNVVAQFARNQLDLTKSTKLATVAQDAAVISGQNSSDTLDQLIHGIATQNSLVLRNAGINVQAGKAMDEYAKSIGKSAKDLTEAERSQAVLNAVLREGKNVAGAYAAAMEEPGKVLRSFPRLINDIQVSVGKGLVDAFGPLILTVYKFTKELSGALAEGGKFNPLFKAFAAGLKPVIAPLTTIIKRLTEWIKAFPPSAVKGMTDAVQRFTPAILAAGAGLAVFAGKQLGNVIPGVGKAIDGLIGPALKVKDIFLGLPGPLKLVVGAFALLMAVSPEFRKAVFEIVGILIDGLKPILGVVVDLLKELMPVITSVARIAGTVLAGVLRGTVVPVLRILVTILKAIEPILKPLIYGFIAYKVAMAAYTVAQIAANIAMLAFPGTWIVLAIAAVVAAIVLIATKTRIFQNVWNALVVAARAAWQFFTSYIIPIFKVILAVALLPVIVQLLIMRAAWNLLGGSVKNVMTNIGNVVGSVYRVTLAPVLAALTSAVRLVGSAFRTVWQQWIAPAWRAVGSVVSSVWNATIRPAFDAIKRGAGAVGEAFRAAQRVIASAMQAVKNAVREPLRWTAFNIINPFLRGANALLGKIGLSIPLIPHFAKGGRIPGGWGGGDRIPIMAEPGEWVLTKRQARAIGYDRLRTLPRYAEGGPVGIAPAWGPTDWIGQKIGAGISGVGSLLKLGKDKIVDPFFKLITRSAFNLLLKVAEPAKKLLQPLANAKIPPGLFRAAAGKLGLKAFDGLLKFIESKVAPDMVEAGIGVAAMAAEVMKRFKGLVITSALRPGDPGYHGRGWARDLGGPVPLMNRAGAWMQTAMVSGLLEGIHNPTLSVKNYKRVPSGFWGGEWPAHADHIHMAAPPAGSAGPSVGPDSIRRIVANIAAKFGLTHLINVAMARIKQESGFNPRAINNWDINARAGTPSVGLAQIIGPTFAAYAAPAFRNKPPMWHGVSLDPWAQIDTMFRYSIARYGKAGLFRAWSGTQGYAEGGILAEPVFGIGLRTGTAYALGERGPELVTPLDGQQPRRSIVVNVYPARGMDETELAASVARRLAWAQATGRA